LSLFRELKRRNVFKVAAAFLFREERFHDFNQRPEALNHAMSSARKAIEIDPLNQNAYYALAFIYFDLGISKLDEFFLAANRAIEHNPNNSRVIGGMGALIAFAGEWERGIA
jgi:Tfp pilus assembly protein PilF